MAAESTSIEHSDSVWSEELQALREFAGSGSEFWNRLAALCASISESSHVLILLNAPGANGDWKQIALFSDQRGEADVFRGFLERAPALATACLANGHRQLQPLSDKRSEPHHLGAIRFQLAGSTESVVAVLLLTNLPPKTAEASVKQMELVADLPSLDAPVTVLNESGWQQFQALNQARADVARLSTGLDLQLELNGHTRFIAAAFALCNHLASALHCQRVSLGWLEKGEIRLRAMSGMEKTNRRMEAAQQLESAMEEALDQNESIVWRPPKDAGFVSRDHERYASAQKVNHVCSLPLHHQDSGVAVVCCERQNEPFDEATVRQLQLALNLVSARLAELHDRDRWWGARCLAATKRAAGKLVGHEHTWAKVIGLIVTAVVVILVFVKVDYRVEGTYRLRSEQVAIHSVPFDGFIDAVAVRPGDLVNNGDLLVSLDTRDLMLEQASALADASRYQREAEKFRAANQLAEMRIAEAQLQQAQARLDRIQHRLDLSTLRATLDGVVVEGDLRERLGAPVNQGDGLVKVAQLSSLYIEADIDERDIHQLSVGGDGEIAFVSQPQLKFPVHIVRIEPMAIPSEEGNAFRVICEMTGPLPEWWRPGMTGSCKLEAGRRSLLWIGTHRTVDFLRLFFWW